MPVSSRILTERGFVRVLLEDELPDARNRSLYIHTVPGGAALSKQPEAHMLPVLPELSVPGQPETATDTMLREM